jgi:hypothetical protein
MKFNGSSQAGSALFVTLILLVMITLFAISMVNTNIVNTKVVGAQQGEKAMEYVAEQAVEKFISTSANFAPAPTTASSVQVVTPNPGTNSSDAAANTRSVDVSAPHCLGETVAPGFSLCTGFNCPPIPQDTVWEISATAADTASGASVTITQGVKVRLPPGNCSG